MALQPTGFRLSNEAREILAEGAELLGINRTAVLELALREFLARHEAELEAIRKRQRRRARR